MEQNKRPRAEAWFHYAEELGLGPYYLDRASEQSQEPAEAEVAAPAVQTAEAGARAGAATSRVTQAPPASKSAPAPAFVPQVAGPSLFEERIENDTLERIRADIGPNCTRCKLHKARTNIVFGVGNPKAELVFVGEGPGRDEDVQGEPFVGRAGKLLTQMIEAMGLRRADVYICNVVKCRPPENRLPEKDEIATCSPFLFRQLGVIQPKVICCLGACSAQTLLNTNQGISRYRGEWFDFRGSKLIATYHPAYLLRNPNAKGEVWKDLQKVMAVLGLQPKRRDHQTTIVILRRAHSARRRIISLEGTVGNHPWIDGGARLGCGRFLGAVCFAAHRSLSHSDAHAALRFSRAHLLPAETASFSGHASGWRPWTFAVVAGLINTVSSLALYRSFEIGVMSIAGPVSSAYPALTVALAFLSGERLHALRGAGLAVTFFGVIFAAISFASDADRAAPRSGASSKRPCGKGAWWRFPRRSATA